MNFKYKNLAKELCDETINKFYLNEKPISLQLKLVFVLEIQSYREISLCMT